MPSDVCLGLYMQFFDRTEAETFLASGAQGMI